MGADWLKELQESPHEFSLGLRSGDELDAPPPYPKLTVIAEHEIYVRRLVWQVVQTRAVLGERTEELSVCRLVAELEGDAGEVELHREIIPSEACVQLPVDRSQCAACGRAILGEDGIEVDGRAYHDGCVV